MQMVRALLALGVTVGGALATRAEEPDALAILKAVNQQTRAVTSVRYDFRYWGEGTEKLRVVPVAGTVVTHVEGRGRPPLFLIEVQSTSEQSPLHQTIAYDGDTSVRIDWTRQSVDQSSVRYRSQRTQPDRQRGWTMDEFTHPTPFDDEINAQHTQYEGRAVVGGVDCHVITVTYSVETARPARWYFGVEDNLPHRVDRLTNEQGLSAMVTELSNIVTTPITDRRVFTVEIPPKFEVREMRRDNGRADRRLTPLLERGREAPSFELPAVQGSPVSLRQLRGRVVLLSFWNSWAEPCEKSLAVVQDLSEKYAGDSLSVVGINVYEDDGVAVAELVRRRGITYPCLIDDGQVARQYRVPGVPALYLINQQGAVIFSTTGTSRLAELPAAIDEALTTVR